MSDLEYYRPERAEDVSALLQREGSRALAGATDVLVQIRGGRARPSSVVDLNSIASLDQIRQTPDGGVQIGATVRLSHMTADPLCSAYPALIEGADTVGSVQVRNRATLAGNVCNASPAADTAPALLVYQAIVNALGPQGRRSIPIEEFWLGPGQTVLGAGEWVESITLPPPSRHGGCYLKLGRTLGTDLAIVGVAVVVSSDETRIALASVAPTPVRAKAAEALLAAAAEGTPDGLAAAVLAAINPISDLRASASYRKAMTVVLVERALQVARKRLAEKSEDDR